MRSFVRVAGVLVLLVVAALAGGYLFLRRYPLVADRSPGAVETAIARRLVRLSIPAEARTQVNPNPALGEAWRAGSTSFQSRCAVCHGSDGRASSRIATKMYPPVPDLADPAIQGMSDGALFAVIHNGVRWTGMPAFRGDLSADEIWQLVSFVRRVPRLSPEDLKPDSSAPSSSSTIAMDGTTFVPPELTIAVGETVTWLNKDPFPHNVSSPAGSFASRDLQPGEEYRFAPKTEGRFPYVCTLHPGMEGTLIVRKQGQH